MNLSTSEAMLILAGCIIAIGAVYVLFRRGVFGGAKADTNAPAGAAKH